MLRRENFFSWTVVSITSMAFRRKRNPATRRGLAGKRKLRKRWYFDATIGKSVPLLGGTGIRMGTGMVKRAVRQELARRQDTKILAGHQVMSGSLKMDTFYTVSPYQLLTQGTDKNQRVGNEIFLRYIRLRGLIGNSSNMPEVKYRVLCVASNKLYTGSTPQNWNGVGSVSASWIPDQLFLPGYGVLYNALIDNQNTNHVVLVDKKLTIRSDTAGATAGSVSVKTIPFDVTCKIMKRVVFAQSGAGLLRNWNYYMVVIPYSPGQATGVDVGFIDSEYLVSFNDS
jgi:hypothetical protein